MESTFLNPCFKQHDFWWIHVVFFELFSHFQLLCFVVFRLPKWCPDPLAHFQDPNFSNQALPSAQGTVSTENMGHSGCWKRPGASSKGDTLFLSRNVCVAWSWSLLDYEEEDEVFFRQNLRNIQKWAKCCQVGEEEARRQH